MTISPLSLDERQESRGCREVARSRRSWQRRSWPPLALLAAAAAGGGIFGFRARQFFRMDDDLVDGGARRPEGGKFLVDAVAPQHVDRRHLLAALLIGHGALDDRPNDAAGAALLLDILEAAIDDRFERIELALGLRPPASGRRACLVLGAAALLAAGALAPAFPAAAGTRLGGRPGAGRRRFRDSGRVFGCGPASGPPPRPAPRRGRGVRGRLCHRRLRARPFETQRQPRPAACRLGGGVAFPGGRGR